jgi:hypothetical protein
MGSKCCGVLTYMRWRLIPRQLRPFALHCVFLSFLPYHFLAAQRSFEAGNDIAFSKRTAKSALPRPIAICD